MKISYDREEDILMIETADGVIDHAEESGQFIVHFTKNDKPVLIEVLKASDFMSMATKSSMTARAIESTEAL